MPRTKKKIKEPNIKEGTILKFQRIFDIREAFEILSFMHSFFEF